MGLQEMKCIIGLGNPGKKYEKTRHNIGFQVIDELAKRHNISLNKSKFKCDYEIYRSNGGSVLFVKPQTFMNLSGEGIQPLMHFFKLDLEDVLVIYDDLDLPTGKIRFREKGGHGGHNGIRSIIQHVGSKDFKKIWIGIGRPIHLIPIVDYVLQPFSKAEKENVEHTIQISADACEMWLEKPYNEVMNAYNSLK